MAGTLCCKVVGVEIDGFWKNIFHLIDNQAEKF